MKNDTMILKERKSIIKSRLARALLNHPEGHLTKYRIAKLAECKYPWAHAVFEKLEEEGIVEETKVKDFKRLFSLWQKWDPEPESREYMVKNPLEILKNTKLEYALTTYQAENIVQDYLFPTRTDFYIKVIDKIKWHELLIEEGLVGKGNTRILITDEHAFYNSFTRNGLTIVSIPQLVHDLLNEGGVCIEAGEMLLQQVIMNAI